MSNWQDSVREIRQATDDFLAGRMSIEDYEKAVERYRIAWDRRKEERMQAQEWKRKIRMLR